MVRSNTIHIKMILGNRSHKAPLVVRQQAGPLGGLIEVKSNNNHLSG